MIGVLNTGAPGTAEPFMAAFRKALGEAGYVEGRNLTIEYRWADGHYDQLPVFATEFVDRCVYALVNEGARILEEGFASRAVDIDIIYINGYGFPAYRGGPMWYADTIGLRKVYHRVRQFQEQHGHIWEPAPLLKYLAEQGKTFAEFTRGQGRLPSGVSIS